MPGPLVTPATPKRPVPCVHAFDVVEGESAWFPGAGPSFDLCMRLEELSPVHWCTKAPVTSRRLWIEVKRMG